MVKLSTVRRRTYKKKGGANNNKPKIKWIFNKKCVIRLLSNLNNILPGEEMTKNDEKIHNKIAPFYFNGFDDDITFFDNNLIRLAGNPDGLTDSCEFRLDSKTGNIDFRPIDTELPRKRHSAPLTWPKNKPFPQPPIENMWIEHSEAIISELLKCSKHVHEL